jgi:drug/metabolite transporter (DMT)-like permease
MTRGTTPRYSEPGTRPRGMAFRFGVGERWAWASMLAYAFASVLYRASAAHIDPWLGSLVRMLPTLVVASIVLAWRGFPGLRPSSDTYIGIKAIVGLMVGGVVSYALGNVWYFLALSNGGLAITQNAVQAGVIWAGIALSLLVLREAPRREQVLGVVIVTSGIAVISASQLGGARNSWVAGLLFAVGAGSCYAVANVLIRSVQRRRDALFATVVCGAVGGFLPLAAIAGVRLIVEPDGMLSGLRPYDVVAVLVAGSANILGTAGMTQAVRRIHVTTSNSIGAAGLVLSAVASGGLFGEVLPPLMVIGLLGVLAGVLVAQAGGRAGARSTFDGAPGSSHVPGSAAADAAEKPVSSLASDAPG